MYSVKFSQKLQETEPGYRISYVKTPLVSGNSSQYKLSTFFVTMLKWVQCPQGQTLSLEQFIQSLLQNVSPAISGKRPEYKVHRNIPLNWMKKDPSNSF